LFNGRMGEVHFLLTQPGHEAGRDLAEVVFHIVLLVAHFLALCC